MNLKTEGAKVLYAYWDKARRGRKMPKVTDVDLVDLASILPNTMIHTAKPDGDFQFRFFGTNLVRSVDADLTGQSLSDLLNDAEKEKSIAELTRVITEPIAMVSRFESSAIEGGRYETEHLFLPLANERGDGIEVISHAKRIEPPNSPRTFTINSFSSPKIIEQEWLPLSQ